MSFRSMVRFFLAVSTFAVGAQTITLPYRPVTAEYSNALDRIIFIAANPNQLHIFDPLTSSDTAVNLPKPPLSLSVSLDGLHAAIGHDALVSYVNLRTATLEKTLTATTTVNSLVLGNDYVYILTYQDGTEWVQISTGQSGAIGVYNGTTGRLHPSRTAIYTTEDGLSPEHLQDIDVSAGPITAFIPAQGPYHGDYAVCGGVWFSPDGRRTYTGCATVYQANPQDTGLGLLAGSTMLLDTKADDLYWGTLSGGSLIRSLTESAALGRIAAIPYSNQYATNPVNDNQVFLYDSAYLEPAGTFQLPDFIANAKNYQAHGQQVFYDQAGTALYVVMQADGTSGLLNDFAVQVFPVSNPQACTPAFNAGNTLFGPSGTIATIAITAPASCIYQASSNSNWLQLVSGAYGSGNGTLTYIVRPNSAVARAGAISIGGQSISVGQTAASTPLNSLTQLGHSVVGADYSQALDRVVLIASSPKELHIYDPVSGSDQIVSLPKTPLCVSVSPDGLSAAVGHDGWVSILNLSTATLTSTIQTFTDVHTILAANNGYVYAYPQDTWGDLFSVQISTKTINVANAIYNGRYPRMYVDGNTFYTEGAKWDISQGVAKLINQNLSGGCEPFWLTEDGARMITSCGQAYTTSPVPSLDLQYNGMFSNAASIQWAVESSKLHSTAVIPSVGYQGTGNEDTYVQIYGDTYLGYSGELLIPTFMVGSTSYAGHGRYVFHNSAADKLIVLEQADSAAKLAADYGVTAYSLTTPVTGCSFTLGSVTAHVDNSGGLDTANLTTGDGCIWEATSNASWIAVNSGAVGFGSGSVSYTVAQNLSGASRNGTLTIAGQTFTVIQGAGSHPILDFGGTGRSGALLYIPGTGNEYTALSKGDGTYSYIPNLITSGFDTLRTGDYNGDGKADLVVYNSHSALAYIGFGNGDGTFAFQSLFWSPGYDFVEPGDLNGDGKTDFALYNSSTGTMYTGISNSDGTFTYKYTLISKGYTFVRLADFTGDGKADLFLYRVSDGVASLGIGDGAGGFTFTPLSISAGYNLVDIGDLDGDGKADVILYNSTNGSAATGIGNGSGGFTFTPLIFTPGFTSVRLADYTGDGKADVTVYNSTNAAAYFGTGTGTGTFNFQSLFWSPGYDWVVPEDVNGDGRFDAILYNSATGTEYTGISNGNGTFSYTYTYWGIGRVLAR